MSTSPETGGGTIATTVGERGGGAVSEAAGGGDAVGSTVAPVGAAPASALRVRVVLLALVVIFLASAGRNIKEEGDFRGYLEVGELVLQHRDIYADARPGINTWPPFFSVLCVPFALLARVSVYLARAVWLVANAAMVYAMVMMAIALVYGRRLTLAGGAGTISLASLAVLGPLVLTSRFFLGNFDRLQINMFILFCCLAACLWLARGRAAAGGALIGFATAVKVLPIFFLPYFLWKRWWTALGAAIATATLVSLSPILVFGPERFIAYARRWLEIASGSWPVRKGNQSVYALVDRLYSHGAIFWSAAHKRLTASDDPVVAMLVYGLLALVVVVFVATARRASRDPASPVAIVEYAIVLTLAVLFSPLAWKHYFVFLLLAYTALWRAAFVPAVEPGTDAYRLDAGDRRRLGWMLGLSFVLTTLTVRGVVGKGAAQTLETLSAVTWGALLALAALLYLRARLAGSRAG